MPRSETLKVLLVAQFYPPVIGGEERHVQALARGLVKRGHHVTVATLQTGGVEDVEEDEGVTVQRLPGTVQRVAGLYQSDRRLAAPIPDPETALALGSLTRSFEPDLVHAHNWLVHSYLPFAVAGRRPLVLSLHDYGQICAKKTLIFREALCSGPGLEKCLRCAGRHYGQMKGIATVAAAWTMSAASRRLVDMFLPVSTAVAVGNRLVEDRLPHQVIPNFIPDDVPTTVDQQQRLDGLPSDGYVLFVGAFARRKGIEVLLDAYRQLPQAPPLVLIGYRSSDDIPALADLPHNVLAFTDWPSDAVAEAWRRSLFGVVPSTWADPCPTVVLEAMAAGKPVIASAIGGMVDQVLPGRTGLLVPHGDAAALAAAMARLLVDPGLRREMGSAALQRSMEYRASTVVRRIEGVYRQVLDERHAAEPTARAAP